MQLPQRSGVTPALLSSAIGIKVPQDRKIQWAEALLKDWPMLSYPLGVFVDEGWIEVYLLESPRLINLSPMAVAKLKNLHCRSLWNKAVSGPLTVVMPEEVRYHLGRGWGLEGEDFLLAALQDWDEPWNSKKEKAHFDKLLEEQDLDALKEHFPHILQPLLDEQRMWQELFPTLELDNHCEQDWPQAQRVIACLEALLACQSQVGIASKDPKKSEYDEQNNDYDDPLVGPLDCFIYHNPSQDPLLDQEAESACGELCEYHIHNGEYTDVHFQLEGHQSADWPRMLKALAEYCLAFEALLNHLEGSEGGSIELPNPNPAIPPL